MTSSTNAPPRAQLLFAYAVLYLVWGSTYLAMKMAVATLPPFTTASLRFVFSGLLLVVLGRALHKRGGADDDGGVPITRFHLGAAFVQGVLLLVCGNACVMWAMKTVPSGVGALILAITPLFMALLARDFRTATWVGLALGTVGIAILVDPFAAAGQGPISAGGLLLLVFAAAAWAVGSVLPKHLAGHRHGKRFTPHPSNAVATGLQMLFGAAVQLGLAMIIGEEIDWATATTSSWLALLYLAVFGSLLGFTCYGWLLKVEPTSRVATYAYVNPVVAVGLGALLGGEAITARVVVAAAVIVVAVVLILRARGRG